MKTKKITLLTLCLSLIFSSMLRATDISSKIVLGSALTLSSLFNPTTRNHLKGHPQNKPIQIFCRNYVNVNKGRTIALDARPTDTLLSLKRKIYAKTGIPVSEQLLIFSGKTLANPYNTLQEYHLRQTSTLHLTLPLLGGDNFYLVGQDYIQERLKEYNQGNALKHIPVATYHVSCRSDKPKKIHGDEMLAGIILYAYNGEIDWYLNNIHCRAGYVILKRSKDIEHIKTKHPSKVHGKVYKSVFGVDLDSKIVVGSGFSYNSKNKEWNFSSFCLNPDKKSGFYDHNNYMNEIERVMIPKSMENWIGKNIQNTDVKNQEIDNQTGKSLVVVGDKTISIKKGQKYYKQKKDL